MATIVFGDNPGPLRTTSVEDGSGVTVLLRDGEGATAHFEYTDIDALNETVYLFAEARDVLAAQMIRDAGVEVPVEAIVAGDQIAVGDRIREVLTVIVRSGTRTLSTRDLFNRTTHQYVCDGGDPVTRIGAAKTAACI